MAVSSQKLNTSKLAAGLFMIVAGIGGVYMIWSYGFTSYLGHEQLLSPPELLAYASTAKGKQKAAFWLALAFPLLILAVLLITALIKRRTLYGDARFGTFAELKSAGLLAKVGVVLGKMRGRYVISDNGHTMVCAPPGGGKSTSIAIPTMLQWPGSLLVMDVKGELFDRIYQYVRENY